jgi:hypothetical protein
MKRLFSLFLIASFALLAGCTRIDSGNIGIDNTLGQVKSETLSSGYYSTVFKNVLEISGKQTHIAFDGLKPKSKDNITMDDFDADIYYSINSSDAPKILTRFAGDMQAQHVPDGQHDDGSMLIGSNFVKRMARSAIFDVAQGHNAADMNAARNDIEKAIATQLQAMLDEHAGKGWFKDVNVTVRSIVPDRNLQEQMRLNADRTFKLAAKQKEIELANAEAQRLAAEAQGVAKANEIISASLTPQLLRMREIETQAKFASAGTHTVIMGGSGAVPLVQVSK